MSDSIQVGVDGGRAKRVYRTAEEKRRIVEATLVSGASIARVAREHGMQIVAYPELAVVHKGTPGSLAEFYRKNRWHGKNVLRLFLAKLPSTRNLPIVALSVYTLVMFWAAIVVPFFAVPRREWWLALLPLGLLLLPAGMLSVKKTASAGSLKAAPALFVLYVTYFLARAAALTHVTRRKRS